MITLIWCVIGLLAVLLAWDIYQTKKIRMEVIQQIPIEELQMGWYRILNEIRPNLAIVLGNTEMLFVVKHNRRINDHHRKDGQFFIDEYGHLLHEYDGYEGDSQDALDED